VRIIITGASGNVGTTLLRILPVEHDVVGAPLIGIADWPIAAGETLERSPAFRLARYFAGQPCRRWCFASALNAKPGSTKGSGRWACEVTNLLAAVTTRREWRFGPIGAG
jgi:hypothetical protein